MEHIITEPYSKEAFARLKSGDKVLLTGTVYTARDAAHRKLIELLYEGSPLPFEISNSIVYYMGPTPPRPGHPIGSAGPTTSYRMDKFTPALLREGMIGMIGKGPRNQDVKDTIKELGGVYFAAIGGTAALIAQCIKSSETIAFQELGTEAIRKLKVEKMPLIVAIDSSGESLFP